MPRAAVAEPASLPAISPDPRQLPAAMPRIMVPSRDSTRPRRGPAASCQTFVISEGTRSRAAASAGGIIEPSRPMATVGRPRPIAPLTSPASRNVAAISGRCAGISFMAAILRAGASAAQCGNGIASLRYRRRLIDGAWHMHLDLTDLRLFLLVVEAGSITAGAARAGLALASASARVGGMEEQVGVPLLERGRRGVRPTPAGSALLHHARLVMQQMEWMRGDLGEHAHGLKGHVRLMANTAAAVEFLPELLAGFLVAHPKRDVDLYERPSIAVTQAVAEGLADLGVAADHADVTGSQTFPSAPTASCSWSRPAMPWPATSGYSFIEALGSDFIGLAGDSALHQHSWATRSVPAAGCGSGPARTAWTWSVVVALGAGVAVVPEAAARRCQDRLGLQLVRLADGWAERRLLLVARHLTDLPLHGRRLAAHLLAEANGQ